MKRKNRGFTLLELIIVIAIAGVLMAGAMSLLPLFFRLNADAHDLGQAQMLAQTKMRAVENELRFADSVDISSALPGTFRENHYYMHLEDGIVSLSSDDIGRRPLTSDRGFEQFRYTISFTRFNPQVVRIELGVTKNGTHLYTLVSEIFASNLLSNSITGEETGSCVCYKISGVPVSSIMVGAPRNGIYYVGDTLQMSAAVFPSHAAKKGVSWSVTPAERADISQDGVLTPLGDGNVTVRATALDGSGVFGEKMISIAGQSVIITSLSLFPQGGAASVGRHRTLQIIAEILPFDADFKELTWSVSNSYATINQNGRLTAGGVPGQQVVVTARTNDGSNLTATLTVDIEP